MIHDVVWESAPMSVAGMSLFVPIVSRISSVNRLVKHSFSDVLRLFRVDDDTAFCTAERQIHHSTLPRHPHREADTLLASDSRVIA